MLKWFRRYNRHLMAVFVAFLMVSWLVSGAITGRGDASRVARDWGTLRGKKVRTDELDAINTHCDILSQLNLPWQMPWYFFAGQQVQVNAAPLNRSSYALISMEAKESQIEASDDAIDRILSSNPNNQALIASIRQARNLRLSDIRAAVADFIRVIRRTQMVVDTIHISEPEIEHVVRDGNEKAQIAYVAFPTDKFTDKSQPVPEEELKAHFEEYKNTPPPAKGAGFGYQHPQRVRIEYLSARIGDLKGAATVTEEQARDYYKKNRETFKRKAPPLDAASQPASSPASASASSPASAPASAPSTAPVMRQLLFREVREEIEGKLKAQTAAARLREIMDLIIADLSKPWILDRGDDGFKKRPAAVEAADYLENLAKQYTARFGIPISFGKTALTSRSDLINQPGIGKAHLANAEPGALQLNEYAFRVPPFFDAKSKGETEIRLAMYEPATTIYQDIDATGDPDHLYLFRVAEARAPEAPASLEDVREKLTTDVRLKRAESIADSMAERLYQSARVMGLQAALDADPGLRQLLTLPASTQPATSQPLENPVKESPLFQRKPYFIRFGLDIDGEVPGLAGSTPVVAAAFEMVADGWQSPPSTAPAATQVTAAATQPAPKVRLVPIPDAHNRVVIEFRKFEPAREDQLSTNRKQVETSLRNRRLGEMLTGWFNEQAIMSRMGFEPANKRELKPEGEPPVDADSM